MVILLAENEANYTMTSNFQYKQHSLQVLISNADIFVT